jgi:hypothetical protein
MHWVLKLRDTSPHIYSSKDVVIQYRCKLHNYHYDYNYGGQLVANTTTPYTYRVLRWLCVHWTRHLFDTFPYWYMSYRILLPHKWWNKTNPQTTKYESCVSLPKLHTAGSSIDVSVSIPCGIMLTCLAILLTCLRRMLPCHWSLVTCIGGLIECRMRFYVCLDTHLACQGSSIRACYLKGKLSCVGRLLTRLEILLVLN